MMQLDHTIDIELTNYCQAACSSCPRTNVDDINNFYQQPWLKLEHADKGDVFNRIRGFSEFYKNRNLTIKLCGEWGDPAMHPDLADIIAYAVGMPNVGGVIVNTNGGIRTPQYWKELALSSRNIFIMWGIDGSTHYYNDMYRKNVNTARAFENMNSWFSNGGNGLWQYLCFAWNYDDWESALQLAIDCNYPIRPMVGSTVLERGIMSPAQMSEFNNYYERGNKHQVSLSNA